MLYLFKIWPLAVNMLGLIDHRQGPCLTLYLCVIGSGAFGIVVKDPEYSQVQPLFEYDVGTACPGTFSVEFVIPTEGSDDYEKTFLVHIVDSFRTIRITVFRPAPNNTADTYGK